MRKKIFQLFVIFIIGGLGGVLMDRLFLPYLANFPFFKDIEFIQQARDRTTIINKTEKIIITENIGVKEAVGKVSRSLVFIQAWSNKKLIQEGTGFILFGDGLIITAADLLPAKTGSYLVFLPSESASFSAQLVKSDSENNLALLQIEKDNLPVVSMGSLEELSLGERVILIGLLKDKSEFYQFINIGAVRSIKNGVLSVNLSEGNVLANGGPLINIKGEVIGLNLVDRQGLTKIVSVNKIKELMAKK